MPQKHKRKLPPEDAAALSADGEPEPESGAEPSASAPKGSKKPKVEKRRAKYRGRCPKNILDRVERVFQQRFFLIARERSGEQLREVFKVLGSTGNVYEVVIGQVPKCSCPDALKGNHCKHILFVFLKVLNVPTSSDLYFQKALVRSELERIFREAKPNPTIIAPQSIRNAYVEATGSSSKQHTTGETSNQKHKDPEGDDCAICYEPMKEKPSELEKKLVWCETCDKALHKECFTQWRSTASRGGNQLTCVYCRSEWYFESSETPNYDGKYLNLGGRKPRDTGSYYFGPIAGVRRRDLASYNEQRYLD